MEDERIIFSSHLSIYEKFGVRGLGKQPEGRDVSRVWCVPVILGVEAVESSWEYFQTGFLCVALAVLDFHCRQTGLNLTHLPLPT